VNGDRVRRPHDEGTPSNVSASTDAISRRSEDLDSQAEWHSFAVGTPAALADLFVVVSLASTQSVPVLPIRSD